MHALRLVNAIATLRPEFDSTEVLRAALLLTVQDPTLAENDPEDGGSLLEEELEQRLSAMTMQLSASSDQHAAIATELDSLAATQPCEFSPDHLWTLVRALKVQGQMLNFYLGS